MLNVKVDKVEIIMSNQCHSDNNLFNKTVTILESNKVEFVIRPKEDADGTPYEVIFVKVSDVEMAKGVLGL